MKNAARPGGVFNASALFFRFKAVNDVLYTPGIDGGAEFIRMHGIIAAYLEFLQILRTGTENQGIDSGLRRIAMPRSSSLKTVTAAFRISGVLPGKTPPQSGASRGG